MHVEILSPLREWTRNLNNSLYEEYERMHDVFIVNSQGDAMALAAYHAFAARVVCPLALCGAKLGEQCRNTISGAPRTFAPHEQRVDEAYRQYYTMSFVRSNLLDTM